MKENNDQVLKKVHLFEFHKRCQHNKFIVDPTLATVECGICKEKLNPIWALTQLCDREARAWRHIEELENNIKKLKCEIESKNRTKCDHCGKFTRICKKLY